MRKLIVAVGMIAVLFLIVENFPLTSDETCDIGILVKNQQGTPISNTRVRLTALDYGSQTTTEYTNGSGYAVFAMRNWPNTCGSPPCYCDATWNEGDYKARALDYCVDVEFWYDGGNTIENIEVGELCQK